MDGWAIAWAIGWAKHILC